MARNPDHWQTIKIAREARGEVPAVAKAAKDAIWARSNPIQSDSVKARTVSSAFLA